MALTIKIREREAPLTAKDATRLHEALGQAAEEARKRGMLGAAPNEAANGNVITMVVGGQDTVLGFDSGDMNSNYASKGASDALAPVMTCYVMMWHHTEFPRKLRDSSCRWSKGRPPVSRPRCPSDLHQVGRGVHLSAIQISRQPSVYELGS